MSVSDEILDIWKNSNYESPVIPLLFFDGDLMVVISDSESFIRFMTLDGQVYLALSRNSEVITAETGEDVYFCSKAYPILCSPTESKDLFVLNKIIPSLK